MGTAVLAFVAAVFHFWMASRMPLTSIIGQYFALSGALFLLGTALVLLRGRGIIFDVGAVGVIALSVIDNGLLYYTRTFGMGFLFNRSFRPPVTNGSFTRTATRTFTGPGFNGTAFPHLGRIGVPWSTSWIPPGAVQFFVLQCAIIVVAVAALVKARAGKETISPAATASA